jgi:hypothetical protein
MTLTEKEQFIIRAAIGRTWQAIGADCEAASGSSLSLSTMIEVCLDANHLESYGGILSTPQPPLRELMIKFRLLTYNQQKSIARKALRGY